MIRTSHLFAAAIAAFVTISAADADAVVRHVTVAYSDLDLSTAAGRAALQERIDDAADKACGGSASFSSDYRVAPRFHDQDFQKCRAAARHEAVTILMNRGVRVAMQH